MALRYPPNVKPWEPPPKKTLAATASPSSCSPNPLLVLLHELAHAITTTMDGNSDGHGEVFMDIYLPVATTATCTSIPKPSPNRHRTAFASPLNARPVFNRIYPIITRRHKAIQVPSFTRATVTELSKSVAIFLRMRHRHAVRMTRIHFKIAPLTNLADCRPDCSNGTIWSSSPCITGVGTLVASQIPRESNSGNALDAIVLRVVRRRIIPWRRRGFRTLGIYPHLADDSHQTASKNPCRMLPVVDAFARIRQHRNGQCVADYWHCFHHNRRHGGSSGRRLRDTPLPVTQRHSTAPRHLRSECPTWIASISADT